MAIASLNRFTVPLQNNQSPTTQGLLMPKLKYRFRAIFQNFGVSSSVGSLQELTKQVDSITRPNLNMNPFTIDVYNSKVNLVGKPTWEPVTVTLRDDAGGNISKLVGEQVQKQFDFAQQSSAASGIDYKFVLRFEILDGGNGTNVPTVLEAWELYGALLQSVNYGDMSYAENSPATVQLTIMYDNAIQTGLEGKREGVGFATLAARNVAGSITSVGR
jgi:hypothetical protein